MPSPIKLSKVDVRRALAIHFAEPLPSVEAAFGKLISIQFDPIAPVGCNHDLVLQARVPGYQIGDWEKIAYDERKIYDGWDKQASLLRFDRWPYRRLYHSIHRPHFEQKIFIEHREAVESILKNLEERGAMMPKDFDFQAKREDWKSSWHGSSVTKQTLRALWHTGLVMTSGRKKGQHLYDLTERVVPAHLFNQPKLSYEEMVKELVLDRHRAMGIVRPSASAEVWSFSSRIGDRKPSIDALLAEAKIVAVDIEGMAANVSPEFLRLLDKPAPELKVTFVAPLDQLMWDRKLIAHAFGFDYVWEIYVPESKRRWGYYVLPVLYGDRFVARAEFYARNGVLEVRQFHLEITEPPPAFWDALELALQEFIDYSRTQSVSVQGHIDSKMRKRLTRKTLAMRKQQ